PVPDRLCVIAYFRGVLSRTGRAYRISGGRMADDGNGPVVADAAVRHLGHGLGAHERGGTMTTPLARRLKRQIGLAGPIPVSGYMAACLFDPEQGYYTTRQPFGHDGDFITAPEISQVFGELLAIWAIQL